MLSGYWMDNREIGRIGGLDQSEAEKLCGRQSDDVTSILGYAGREEIIHWMIWWSHSISCRKAGSMTRLSDMRE